MADFKVAGLLLLSYLAGGIPTGFLAVWRLKGYDIRTKGSGNPGTANVYRNAGPAAGLITLVVDAGKGWLPVLLASRLFPEHPWVAVACGAAAIVGHNWTPFLRFKGGKGVATTSGVFLALMPLPMAATIATFVVAVKVSGHISVGSMTSAAALPLFAALSHQPPVYVVASLLSSMLIWVKHIPNLQRLMRNRELGIHGPSA